MKRAKLFIAISLISLLLVPIYCRGEGISWEEFRSNYVRELMIIDVPMAYPKLTVDDSRIYLTDKRYCNTIVLSLANGNKITEFGTKGEGPSELRGITGFYRFDGGLCVSGYGKLCIYSKDGTFRKELRIHNFGRDFIPFGDRFICRRWNIAVAKKGFVAKTYYLLDSSLEKNKEIATFQHEKIIPKDIKKKPRVFFNNCRKAVVYKNRFYVAHTDLGFYIAVFDSDGKRLYEIKKDYEKVPVTQDVKDKVIAFLKKVSGDSYHLFLAHREYYFPDYFPAFQDFYIHKDKIIFFKHPKSGSRGRIDIIITNLKGNILSQKNIPFHAFFSMLQEINNISFYNGKLYFMFRIPEDQHKLVELNVAKLME